MLSHSLPEGPSYQNKTVLLVDADPEVSAMLARVVTPAGWAMQSAPDNRTALGLIEAEPFHLIITSERTSALEDVELLRKIRRVRPHTRMIILTDASTPADVIACMRERA